MAEPLAIAGMGEPELETQGRGFFGGLIAGTVSVIDHLITAPLELFMRVADGEMKVCHYEKQSDGSCFFVLFRVSFFRPEQMAADRGDLFLATEPVEDIE